MLRRARRHPHVRVETVGRTVDGRPMPLVTITDPRIDDMGKKVVWLMFRQHSWEAGSSWAGEGALLYLLTNEAVSLRERVAWKIFPMADPDGVARGGVRFNKHGFDLNRNWDAVDARKMPEIAAQKKAMYDWLDSGHRIDFFLSLHNTESGEYLEGPPGGASGLGARLYGELVKATTFHPSSLLREAGVSTTPGQAGRMTVNQALWTERKLPAFLMEQRVEHNEKLGRYPTTSDRLAFGTGLVKAIAVAVVGGNEPLP
jgi:hypothetical protein